MESSGVQRRRMPAIEYHENEAGGIFACGNPLLADADA
jgi:hypothetical protein